MSSAEEKIVGMLRRLSGAPAGNRDRTLCPDEEVLSQFLNGGVAAEVHGQIETHLADCRFCVEELIAAYDAAESGAPAPAPQWLVQQAMALVADKEAFLDLVARLIRNSIELISTSGRVVPIPSPVLRSEPQPAASNALQVEQDVGRFKIAVEIDVSHDGGCQLVANVAEPSGAPADGVRLTLNACDREQASFLTRSGVVVFDRIAPGEYRIDVSEAGNVVGKIRVNLMLDR